MKRKLFCGALFIVMMNIATASNELQKIDLGRSYITVSKYETTINNLPKNIHILEKEDIQESNARNLIELLNTVPSIFVGSGYTNSGVVDFRGQGEASDRNVLILINGIPQNPIDMSGVDFSIIDINSIERIEIIPSGGVIYGDRAVGGVINIITNKEGRSVNIETASYGYENYNFSYGDTFNNNLNLYTNFSITMEDGYRKHSEYEKQTFNIGAKYELNERNFLSFDYSYSQGDYKYPGSLTKKELDNNRKDSLSGQGESYTRQNSYAVKYEYIGDNLEVENIIAYKDKYNKAWSKIKTENLVNNFKVKYSTEKNALITGIDFSQGESESNKVNKIKKEQAGIFIHNIYSLSEEFILNAGYRYEQVELKYQDGENKKYNKNLFAAGLNYIYSDTGSTYISFEQNYRTPTTDEYQYAIYDWSTFEIIGYGYNEDLKPQLSNVIETGLREYIGNTYITMSIFSSLTKDEIFYNPSTFSNENYDGTVLRNGFEFSSISYINNTNIYQSFSYIDSTFKDGDYKGKIVPWVPQIRYNLKSDYRLMDDLYLTGEYSYTDKVYAISDWSNSHGKIDSYSIFNLGINYNWNDLKVYGGIKNLFDEKYNEYVVNHGFGHNYYPAKERNYYLGIKYEF